MDAVWEGGRGGAARSPAPPRPLPQPLPGPSPSSLTPATPPRSVFFDSCDGFFTNYNWQKEHLERMQGLAGGRLADIYVGVDVFARGNVVGGGFDTSKVGGGRAASKALVSL